MRLVVLFLLLSLAGLAAQPSDPLYSGWMKMYDLQFGEAHQLFRTWEATHPTDAMGPASQAAGYLFAEFARLGVLESELFVEDSTWKRRKRLVADGGAKNNFFQELDRADRLADAALAKNEPGDKPYFVKSLALGLRADYYSMIERQTLLPLKLVKESRMFSDRAIERNPKDFDAHLGPGIENYLLSLKPAPVRMVLGWTGAQTDRTAGVEQLKLTAERGRFLEPFAKLLLAVAALRDKHPQPAIDILRELHRRFPANPLYLRELDRILKGQR